MQDQVAALDGLGAAQGDALDGPGLGAATLIKRLGAARVAAVGTLSATTSLFAAAVAASSLPFATALFVAGAPDSITDVAQNSHGLSVQRRCGRSIINSLHAVWSVGAILGGIVTAGASAAGVPRALHVGGSAVVLSSLALIAARFCLPC